MDAMQKTRQRQIETDKQEAMVELSTADPDEPKKIRKLQNIIYCHDEMTARLSTLILDGDIAQQEILDGATVK